MVYKKYIKINGKLHGPYYYESYRENGVVKKRYLGTTLPRNNFQFTLLIISIVLVALMIFSVGYSKMTGNSILGNLFGFVGQISGNVVDDVIENSDSGANEQFVSEQQNLEVGEPPAEESSPVPEEPFVESPSEESSEDPLESSVGNETIPSELPSNETIVNETLTNETITVEQNAINVTIKTSREGRIVLGKPVKWTKNITLDAPSEGISVELPASAENIEVTKIDDDGEGEAEITISGNAIYISDGFNFLSWLSNIFSKLALTLTGRVVDEGFGDAGGENIEVILQDNATEYVIEYETPAPTAEESEVTGGKQIVISGPDELNYTDILAYTYLDDEAMAEDVKLYHIVNETREIVALDVYDENENGLIDYIEWNVPHLSEQTYLLIIEISKAEHLDENRTFISDIYDYVKAKDGNWSEQINDSEYVRVTFEHNLTSSNDITLYARSAGNESASIEIYLKDGSDKIAEIGGILGEGEYKTYLVDLNGRHDTFDLKIVGAVEIDWIIDPIPVEELEVIYATLASGRWETPLNATIDVTGLNEIIAFAGMELEPKNDIAVEKQAYLTYDGTVQNPRFEIDEDSSENAPSSGIYWINTTGQTGSKFINFTHDNAYKNKNLFIIANNATVGTGLSVIDNQYVANLSPIISYINVTGRKAIYIWFEGSAPGGGSKVDNKHYYLRYNGTYLYPHYTIDDATSNNKPLTGFYYINTTGQSGVKPIWFDGYFKYEHKRIVVLAENDSTTPKLKYIGQTYAPNSGDYPSISVNISGFTHLYIVASARPESSEKILCLRFSNVVQYPCISVDESTSKNSPMTTFSVVSVSGLNRIKVIDFDKNYNHYSNKRIVVFGLNTTVPVPLTNEPPAVSLDMPDYGLQTKNTTLDLNGTLYDDYNLANATIFIWNSTQDIVYSNLQTVTGTSNYSNWTYSGFSIGTYTWNILASDNGSLSGSELVNRTIVIQDSAPPLIWFVNNTPQNSSVIRNSSFEVNVSIVEGNLTNVSYEFNSINYTIYDRNLLLMLNLDNKASLGDSSTIAHDSSVYDIPYRIINATWNAFGKYIKSMRFDGFQDYLVANFSYFGSNDYYGSNDYAEPNDTSFYDMGHSSFTLAAWINTSSLFASEDGRIISKAKEYALYVEGDDASLRAKPGFTISDGTNISTITANFVVNSSRWHHLVGVRDRVAGNISVYVDGVLYNRTIDNTTYLDNQATLLIGGGGATAQWFNGSIDEVRVWKRAFNASEVYEMYASNLEHYNYTQWYLYVNQSGNATSGLALNQQYSIASCAVDDVDNINCTDRRIITYSGNAPNITSTIAINESGTSGGTVRRGSNVTINATITDFENDIDRVWVKIWEGVAFISNVIYQGFMTLVGGIWTITIPTNMSFPLGMANYTVYVNDSAGNEANLSSNFTILDASLPALEINRIYPLTDVNVTQNRFFNVTVNVTCRISDCGAVNVTLDPPFDLRLNSSTNILRDLKYFDGSRFKYGTISKWNISILANSTFDHAEACFWINSNAGSPPNSIAVWRVANQTWDLPVSISNMVHLIDLQSFNQSNTTLTSTTPSSWACFNITYQLSSSILAGDTNFSFRIHMYNQTIDEAVSPTSPIFDGGGLRIGYDFSSPQILFEDSENFYSTGNLPYLNISGIQYLGSSKVGAISTIIGDTPFYTNESNPRPINMTVNQSEVVTFWVNATGAVGSTYDFYAFANMTNGTIVNASNQTTHWNVTIIALSDENNPNIMIISPLNQTYNVATINFNVSANENLSSCLFTLNNWATNYTMSAYNATYFNYTNATMGEGSHTARFWCNDTSGNINATESVTFGIDTIPPFIQIISPQNITYDTRTILVNITNSSDAVNVWFFNGSANVSYSSPVYVEFAEGSNAIYAYANDSIGNVNQTSVIFGVSISYTSEGNSSEWKMFRRWLNHTAWDGVQYPSVSGLNIAWYLTGGNVFSSPAVVNGSVYVGSFDGKLYHFNATNVSLKIGEFDAGSAIRSSPAVVNEYVYVGCNDNKVYQLNATNVSQKIAEYQTLGQVWSSPSVANGYVYVGSNDNRTYQLNATNVSQKIAEYATGFFVESSPAIANGYVYVGSYDDKVYQLNASNISQKIAEYLTDANVYSSPAVTQNYVYVASTNGTLYQFNATNVSQMVNKFTSSTVLTGDGPYGIFASPAVANGFVYIASYNSNVYQLNESNISQQIAQFTTGDYIWSSPAVAGGYVYVGSWDNQIYQLNASNISIKFANLTDGLDVQSSPAIANGYIYIGSQDRRLYQLNASNITEINVPDFFSPLLTIVSPLNQTYNTTRIDFNVSSNENLNFCMFSLNNWVTNYTMSAYSTTYFNYTNATMGQGSHTARFWCNDTSGNVNATESVTFFIDSIPPGVLIVSPQNRTYNQSWASNDPTQARISVNVTTSENTSSCIYSTNPAFTSPTLLQKYNDTAFYLSAFWANQQFTVYIGCNDTFGNVNETESVTFYVDVIPPVINFTSQTTASGVHANSTPIVANVTASDNKALDTIIVSLYNSTGIYNITYGLTSSVFLNYSYLPIGNYTLNASANDSLNNWNWTETRYINITTPDITAPEVTIVSPVNQTYSVSSYTINITLNEAGYCEYSLNNGSTNNTLTSGNGGMEFTGSVSGAANGDYILNAYCNDTSANRNDTESVNFTIFVSSDSCFIAGTLIDMADGSKKKIEDVKLWESVLGYNYTSDKFVSERVLELESPVREGYYLINGKIGVTDEHPFYTQKKSGEIVWAAINKTKSHEDLWDSELANVPIYDFEVGDKIFSRNKEWVRVDSIVYYPGNVQTYNLKTVDVMNVFFADGFLVHNKDGGCTDTTWTCTNSTCVDGTKTETCRSDNCPSHAPRVTHHACCLENWNCTEWSTCLNGTQERTCTDLNGCGTTVHEPEEVRECGDLDGCPPMWKCGPWGECTYNNNPNDIISGTILFKGVQFRDCEDLKKCKKSFIDNQTCRGNVSVDIRKANICGVETIEAVNSETNVPISVINAETWKNYEKFDVSFIQSADMYCPSCFNAVLDSDEDGIDCGGFCRACRPEWFKLTSSWRIAIVAVLWAWLLLLSILLLVLRRRGREEERRIAEVAARVGGLSSVLANAENAFEKGIEEDIETLEFEGKKAVRIGKEITKEGKDVLSSLDPYNEELAKKEVKKWFESDKRKIRKK